MQDEAKALLQFAATYLQKPCPDLPIITIDPDLTDLGRIEWGMRTRIKLKHWRDGNVFDRSVLLHELVHRIQHWHDMELSEVEAITCQLLWLQSQGEDARIALSYAAIHKMTNDPQFSKLEWL